MTVRPWSAANRVIAAWTRGGGARLDPDDVGSEVGAALGRLDRDDARDRRHGDGGGVIGAADDDPELVLVEAREQLGGRGRADEPAAIEDRDVVADALDVVEDVGRVEDRDLAPELAHEVEDLAATDRVERADGLVEEQDGRRADRAPGRCPSRWRIPPEYVPVRRSAASARPTRARTAATMPRPSARSVGRIQRGDEAERLATGHPVVEARLLGEVADLAAVAGAGPDRDAGDRRGPAGRPGQAGEDLDGGRLAGAVGAEEAVDGAGRDVEAEVGQGRHARIVLGESGRRDGRVDGSSGSFSVCGERGRSRRPSGSPGARSASSVRGLELATLVWIGSRAVGSSRGIGRAHPVGPSASIDPGRISPAS